MSPGIEALRNLEEILDRGTFILLAEVSSIALHTREFALALELAAVSNGGDGIKGTAPARTLDMEHLLGLRARLAIMEVPEEEEKRWASSMGHGASVVVDAFKHQLQVRYKCTGLALLVGIMCFSLAVLRIYVDENVRGSR